MSLILPGVMRHGAPCHFCSGFSFFGKLDPLMPVACPCSRVLLRILPPHLLVPARRVPPSPSRNYPVPPRRVPPSPSRLDLPPLSPACTPLHSPRPVVSLYCLHVTTCVPLFVSWLSHTFALWSASHTCCVSVRKTNSIHLAATYTCMPHDHGLFVTCRHLTGDA